MVGHIDQAEHLLTRALNIDKSLVRDKRLSSTDTDFASTLNSLGMIDAYRDRWDDASAKFEQAKEIAELPGGPFLDQVLLNEADLALHTGDLRMCPATFLTRSRHPSRKPTRTTPRTPGAMLSGIRSTRNCSPQEGIRTARSALS